MTTTEILNLVIPALITTILVPLIGSALAALTSYLKTKTHNATLDKYIERANDAVVSAVSETMQTYVTTMKQSGQWTQATAAAAFEAAKMRAQEIMGSAALQALPEVVGDVDKWLSAKIETATLTQKQMAGTRAK